MIALGVSYLIGHLVHAALNFLPLYAESSVFGEPNTGRHTEGATPRHKTKESFLQRLLKAGTEGVPAGYKERLRLLLRGLLMPGAEQMHAATLGAIDRTLVERYGIDGQELPAKEKYLLLDESRVLLESAGDRDVYVYREGFYGGMLISSAILATGLLIQFIRPIALPGLAAIPRPQLFVFFMFTVVTIPLWYERWRRFGHYRVTTAAGRWLAVASHEGWPKAP